MTEFCFAEFAKCLQSAMQPPNDDKDVVELLLGWITDMPSVMDKKGNPVHLAPSLKSGVGSKNMRASHIVVAYFIQNCEVFREISK